MVSYLQLDLDLSVYACEESAINIIDGKQVAFFSDQCMFFNKSQVYEVSHGP